jgi:hypothetical protein
VYRIIEMEGPQAWVDETLGRALHGSMEVGYGRLTAAVIEVAPGSAAARALAAARLEPPRWEASWWQDRTSTHQEQIEQIKDTGPLTEAEPMTLLSSDGMPLEKTFQHTVAKALEHYLDCMGVDEDTLTEEEMRYWIARLSVQEVSA